MSIPRRLFLQQFAASGGCFVVSALLRPLSAHAQAIRTESNRFAFAQGVASADPQPDAVVFWTRVTDTRAAASIPLTLQVSTGDSFDELLVEEVVAADASVDHTVRCFVDGLSPDSFYWYRFLAPDGYASRVGRTRTAPSDIAPACLNLAVFCCQDYETGFFNAYRQLVLDDAARPVADRTHLCLHVGDFIYENVGKTLRTMDGVRSELANRDGSARTIDDLPSGGQVDSRNQLIPTSLDDFRHIYRRYLQDEALLEARALYPFVCIWDDHELVNDYWQSYGPNGPIADLKVAANQAWFEYIPAALTSSRPGPAGVNDARDFSFADVTAVGPGEFDDHYLSLEENNRKAIGSLTIYRSLTWGRDVDLMLLDSRSYRGARGVEDSLLANDDGVAAYPAAPLDPLLIRTLNAGRTANDGNPPATIGVFGREVPNPRLDRPYGSLLGETQKEWLKQSLVNSSARWKVICNSVPLMRFGFDNSFAEQGHKSGLYYTDSWDGYPVERTELMSFILDRGLANVVSLTGDRHANFAGVVHDDFDFGAGRAVIPEFAGASVSGGCRFKIQRRLMRSDPALDELTTCDGEAIGYIYRQAPLMNGWMLFGAETAREFGANYDRESALALADDEVNPHLAYADCDAYGYYRISFLDDALRTEYVVLPEPVENMLVSESAARRRVHFEVQVWQPGDEPEVRLAATNGESPFLGLKTR